MKESGKAHVEWIVEKYHGNFKSRREIKEKNVKPYEVIKKTKNILLSEGIQQIWRLVAGETGQTPYNATNAHIGVGNGTLEPSRDQTGLQGTDKFYKIVDEAPVVEEDTGVTPSTYRIVFTATFGGTEANFAWNELTVANGNSDLAANLNRLVNAWGTKSEGSTWIAICRIKLT